MVRFALTMRWAMVASETRNGGRVYTAEQPATLLEVSRDTIIRWIEAGLLRGSQITSGAPQKVDSTSCRPYPPAVTISNLRCNLEALFSPRIKVAVRKFGEPASLKLLAVSESRCFVS